MKLTFIIGFLLFFSQSVFSYQYLEVREHGLIADFYYTEGHPSQRAIIFFGGSDGGNIISKNMAFKRKIKSYVDQGYAVLSLSYFHYYSEPTLPKSLTNIPLEYFQSAIKWVTKQPGVQNDGVAVYGNSRGGELALLLASYFPEIKVVIAAVPSAYIWGAYGASMTTEEEQALLAKKPCGNVAWTYQGKEIAGICYSTYLEYNPWYTVIDNAEEVEPFAIQVEKMQADVLLLSGKHDKMWPSTEMSNRVIERLKANNYSHVYRHISYEEGHSVILASWKDALAFVQKQFPVMVGEANEK